MRIGLKKVSPKTGIAEWKAKHPVTGEAKSVSFIGFADGTGISLWEDGTATVYPQEQNGLKATPT